MIIIITIKSPDGCINYITKYYFMNADDATIAITINSPSTSKSKQHAYLYSFPAKIQNIPIPI